MDVANCKKTNQLIGYEQREKKEGKTADNNKNKSQDKHETVIFQLIVTK